MRITDRSDRRSQDFTESMILRNRFTAKQALLSGSSIEVTHRTRCRLDGTTRSDDRIVYIFDGINARWTHSASRIQQLVSEIVARINATELITSTT